MGRGKLGGEGTLTCVGGEGAKEEEFESNGGVEGCGGDGGCEIMGSCIGNGMVV